jgi:hypothetical protein
MLIMKLVQFVLPLGGSRLARSRNLPRIFIRASGCAVVGLFCSLSAFRAWPADCASPPAGLVGWWPGGGNANDIAGTNNGTLSGGASFASGEVGQAFSFDGINGTVTVPDSSSLRLTNQLTIEAWINARSISGPGGYAIVGKVGFGTGNNGYQLDLVGTTLQGLFNSPGYNWPSASIVSGSIITTGVWYHVAYTYDQSAMKLYCNGQPVATNVIGAHAIATSTTALRISGADNQGYFDGLIDEPSVYNRALSANEIAAIYNAGSAGKCRLPRVSTASAVVLNNFVVGATITDGGYGYTNTPAVRIIGGGGSGAQAVAVVSNGVVDAVNVLVTGSGYTNTPVIVIAPPFIEQPTMGIAAMSGLNFTNLAIGTNYQLQFLSDTTWSNMGAAFAATGPASTQYVSGAADPNGYRLAISPLPRQASATVILSYGFVVHATVTSGGSGYVTTPVVSIVGGGGSNATAVAQISGGVVSGITITDAGIGYTNRPTVEIDPPPVFAVAPTTVLPVMRLDSANLSPYDNYQIQFKSALRGAWGNWDGGLFSPTDVTNSQYLLITNGVGFFRLQYVP